VIQDGEEINRSELSSPIDVQWGPSMPQVVQIPILGENSTSFDAGTEMSLNCLSDANPAPQYSWRILDKNNRTLADLTHWTSETRDLNNIVLRTLALEAADSDVTFICTAENLHGSKSSKIQFIVTEIPSNAGAIGLLWALVGVVAVVLAVAVCMMINRWIQRRRSGIYKTEVNQRDGSADSLNDELQAAAKKEYFM